MNNINSVLDRSIIQVTLAEQEIILKEKNKAAEALIEVVGAESEKVSKEKAFGMHFNISDYYYRGAMIHW